MSSTTSPQPVAHRHQLTVNVQPYDTFTMIVKGVPIIASTRTLLQASNKFLDVVSPNFGVYEGQILRTIALDDDDPDTMIRLLSLLHDQEDPEPNTFHACQSEAQVQQACPDMSRHLLRLAALTEKYECVERLNSKLAGQFSRFGLPEVRNAIGLQASWRVTIAAAVLNQPGNFALFTRRLVTDGIGPLTPRKITWPTNEQKAMLIQAAKKVIKMRDTAFSDLSDGLAALNHQACKPPGCTRPAQAIEPLSDIVARTFRIIDKTFATWPTAPF